MAVSLSLLAGAGWQFFDDNGNPLSGGLLYTYEAGTATPLATYTDSNGNVANANPIVLDAAGRSANQIWLNPAYSYKFVLKTSLGITVWTEDDVPGYGSSADVTFLQAGTGAVARTVQSKLRDVVSVKDFGAVGDGVADDTAEIQAAIDFCLLNGASLYVPSGSYRLASQVNVPLNSALVAGRGLIIYGDGWGSKFIIDHTGQGFYVNCIPSLNVFNAQFCGLYFTDGASSPARIIHNDGACNTIIRDCIFQNATVGVGCVVNDNAYGLTLQNCNFHGIVGTGVFYAQTPSLSTYSFVNSIFDCDFSGLSNGVEIQGCSALFVANTVFQECDRGFYANPVSTGTTAFNITLDTCWFERNTLWDIELNSNASYWCEASIRNCQFSGFPPTFQAQIQLAQKSKVTIEGTPAGNTVVVHGANDAAAVLIRATNFVQSGVYAWTTIEADGDTSVKSITASGAVAANATAADSGVVYTAKESASLSAAYSLWNRNSTQQWKFAVDAAAVDDKLFALINGSFGNVPLTVNATNNNVSVALGDLIIGSSGKGIEFSAGNVIKSGSGSPQSVVTAPVGSMYLRTDGGAGTTLYIKESGTGNTGWVAK